MSTPKKILGPVELITLVAVVAILGYILFKQGGCNVMQRAEGTEMIENPGGASWKEYRYKKEGKSSKTANQMLRNIANQFAERKTPDWRSFQRKGLSAQEVKFYKKIQIQYNDRIYNDKDWFPFLKEAKEIFGQLSEILTDISGQPAETLQPHDLERIVSKSNTADDFYKKLRQVFKISSADATSFAQSGEHEVSDWAIYILEKTR